MDISKRKKNKLSNVRENKEDLDKERSEMIKIFVYIIFFHSCSSVKSSVKLQYEEVVVKSSQVRKDIVQPDNICTEIKGYKRTVGCISSLFLQEIKIYSSHNFTESKLNGSIECMKKCGDSEIFALARKKNVTECLCLNASQIMLDMIGPLVYCDGVGGEKKHNNFTEVYYSLYCVVDGEAVGVPFPHDSVVQHSTAKPSPPTLDGSMGLLYDKMDQLINSTEVVSGLLACILVILVLVATYQYYWKQELDLISSATSSLKKTGEKKVEYGTQNPAYIPDIQVEADGTAAGNSTFYNVEDDQPLPTESLTKEGRSKFYRNISEEEETGGEKEIPKVNRGIFADD